MIIIEFYTFLVLFEMRSGYIMKRNKSSFLHPNQPVRLRAESHLFCI